MDDDPDFVPYSQRPEWSDVVPAEAAPGDDGSVVSVKYSKHDKELLGYFNACVAKVSANSDYVQFWHTVVVSIQNILHAVQVRYSAVVNSLRHCAASHGYQAHTCFLVKHDVWLLHSCMRQCCLCCLLLLLPVCGGSCKQMPSIDPASVLHQTRSSVFGTCLISTKTETDNIAICC
jgi:hypothetical protein